MALGVTYWSLDKMDDILLTKFLLKYVNFAKIPFHFDPKTNWQ